MRLLLSIVCVGLSITLLVGGMFLYWWVPEFKALALGAGTELTGGQVLLITLSDIVVIYWYAMLPIALAIGYGLCRVAFASENEIPQTES